MVTELTRLFETRILESHLKFIPQRKKGFTKSRKVPPKAKWKVQIRCKPQCLWVFLGHTTPLLLMYVQGQKRRKVA